MGNPVNLLFEMLRISSFLSCPSSAGSPVKALLLRSSDTRFFSCPICDGGASVSLFFERLSDTRSVCEKRFIGITVSSFPLRSTSVVLVDLSCDGCAGMLFDGYGRVAQPAPKRATEQMRRKKGRFIY